MARTPGEPGDGDWRALHVRTPRQLSASDGRPPRTRVFISYCHRDREWLDRLSPHLRPLVGDGEIDVWDDTRLDPGDLWKSRIAAALKSAGVAVLLVTANFLASDFIQTKELPRLLDAAAAEGCRIIPVIVKPSLFLHTELAGFQSANPATRPLSAMSEHEQEEVFLHVALTLKKFFYPSP
jgi:hypothetical protein